MNNQIHYVYRHITLIAIIFFACIRIFLCAIYNIVSDCDEVFNYWEPIYYISFIDRNIVWFKCKTLFKNALHILSTTVTKQSNSNFFTFLQTIYHFSNAIYKLCLLPFIYLKNPIPDIFALQTWEYSPNFALRSYFYVVWHAIIVIILRFFFSLFPYIQSFIIQTELSEGVLTFFTMRACLGGIAVAAEMYFFSSLSNQFQNNIPFLYLLINLTSPGLFLASNQLLPSSSFMIMSLITFSLYLHNHLYASVISAILGTLLTWPFAGIIYIPLGIVALKEYRLDFFLKRCTIIGSLVLLCVGCVDYLFYGKIVCTPFNLIIYNTSLGSGSGKSTLYGIEDGFYYFRNLFLNFHIHCILSLFGIGKLFYCLFQYIIQLSTKKTCFQSRINQIYFVCVTPIIIWVSFMSLMPHKEERFLTPIYPLICLSAAIGLNDCLSLINTYVQQSYDNLLREEVCPFKNEPTSIIESSHYGLLNHYEKVKQSKIKSIFCNKPASQPEILINGNTSKTLILKTNRFYRVLRIICVIGFCGCTGYISTARIRAQYRYYWHPIIHIWSQVSRLRISITNEKYISSQLYDKLPIQANTLDSNYNIISKTNASFSSFNNPIELFHRKNNITPLYICIGADWFRYPSSFFLPKNGGHLGFLRSGFTGLLPKKYNGTGYAPDTMNDNNIEQLDHYTRINRCHYMVDSTSDGTQFIPRATLLRYNNVTLNLIPNKNVTEFIISISEESSIIKHLTVVDCQPLLDSSKTKFPYRSFFFSNTIRHLEYLTFTNFCLWKLEN